MADKMFIHTDLALINVPWTLRKGPMKNIAREELLT